MPFAACAEAAAAVAVRRAARRQHLQDCRRSFLDRPPRDIDRHPLAPRIEAAGILDLALHLFHVGVFGFGFLLQQAQTVYPDLHQPLGIGDQADDQRPFRLLELRRRRYGGYQRHGGRAHTAVGEINAGRRLGGPRWADQDDVGILQVVRRLPVIMRQRVMHGIDSVEITFVELMLAARPLLALGMKMDGKHAHRLVENADAGQLQPAAMVADEIAQFLVDQRIKDGPAIALDRLHDLFHLPARSHQGPDMLLYEDALVLNQAGTRHAGHRFAGGVGHEMNVKIAVGHAVFYPTHGPGETRDWRQGRGDSREIRAKRVDSGPDSPLPSRLPSLADSPGGKACESGISPSNRVESASAGPQRPGEKSPIGRIPTCHRPYYCYYLLRLE